MSRRVIGASIEVHKALGPGYPREVYANALGNELEVEEIQVVRDRAFDVEFEDIIAGQVVADFYIGDRFLVMILARYGEVGGEERSRLRAQLRAADLELGLIINFGERRLKDGLVRVLNPDKIESLRAAQQGGAQHEEPAAQHDEPEAEHGDDEDDQD